jgi:aminopeptidase-like protein
MTGPSTSTSRTSVAALPRALDRESAGCELYALVEELYPICRSITGDGVRETLRRLGERIPLAVHEVPTGTRVLDWTIPREWNVRDAWVADETGRRVIDFRASNLHLVSYSTPVRTRMSLEQLRPYLATIPEHPDWVPYRTSYYEERFGFCLSQNALDALPDGEYEVCVDTTLEDGSLTYAECVLPGTAAGEVLISAHVCHPSLCNDNLSGVAVATLLARALAETEHALTYRFLFAPGTIGAITWLHENRDALGRLRAGLVLACCGDAGRPTYKRSRRGDTTIDRAVEHVLRHAGDHEVLPFEPFGYDERQFCSPGFDLPVGCLMRTPFGRYPEYHSSADDLRLVRPEALADTYALLLSVATVLEDDRVYLSTSPYGEPQLGRRGLFRSIGGRTDTSLLERALLWVLNQADGSSSLLDVAERSGLPFATVREAADLLLQHELLAEVKERA